VVLTFGADSLRARRLEARRFGLVEETVQKVSRLVLAEETALVDEAGELQHHLFPVADSGHDRLHLTAAEALVQARHRAVEIF